MHLKLITAHLRSNLVGWIALFIALGGTGYAAVSIPRNSVGAAQIRNHSIDPVKFNPAVIGGSARAWAIVRANGTVIAGSGRPTVTTSPTNPGFYDINWGIVLPATCATSANIDLRSPAPTETVQGPAGAERVVAGYVSSVFTTTAVRSVKPRRLSTTGPVTLNQAGQPTPLAFDVTVIC